VCGGEDAEENGRKGGRRSPREKEIAGEKGD
jgi:hypothetical protein